MNCNIFKKKLNDYIEHNITDDMKAAMDKHIEKCESCRKIYEEEIKIDEEFKSVFKIDGIEFSSSRSEIMKNIDKNRYSKKKSNKIAFYFKKNKYKYMSTAAAAAILIISLPIFMKNYNYGDKSMSENINYAANAEIQEMDKDDSISSNKNASDKNLKMSQFSVSDEKKDIQPKEDNEMLANIYSEEAEENKLDRSGLQEDAPQVQSIQSNTKGLEKSEKHYNTFEDVFGRGTKDENAKVKIVDELREIKIKDINTKAEYLPQFKIAKIDENSIDEYGNLLKDCEAEFKYSLVDYSPNKKFAAVIHGFDWGNVDLGIHEICIKNLQTGEMKSYKIIDNHEKNTPMDLEWWDDENLLIVVGHGYGTISKGGSIYSLNINTGDVKLIYERKEKEYVYRITKVQNDIYLNTMVYDDDFNKFHIERAVIKNYEE